MQDVLTAKTMACVRTLEMATDQGIPRIQLEMDSSLLKQAILSSSVDLAASGMLSRDVVKHDHFVCVARSF